RRAPYQSERSERAKAKRAKAKRAKAKRAKGRRPYQSERSERTTDTRSVPLRRPETQRRNRIWHMTYDVAIIGGGIVGLATAYQLSRLYPDFKVVVFEKEDRVAAHQTGRNSGVIHSGVYYRPGSLRAE